MNQKKSIIYVNYSPYENSGKILDFLLENYNIVFLFSIGFHDLGNNRKSNKLTVYEGGKEINTTFFYHMTVPKKLVFFLVPVRSTINFFQILFYSLLLKNKYGKIDTYFSVNAFTAFLGIFLKKIGVVESTIFWVWDYYPLIHPNKIVLIMRWMYWQFDKLSSKSDKVVFLNSRMKRQWFKKGIISERKKYPLVPIGTDFVKVSKKRDLSDIKLGFIGVIKKSQGLDILFDSEKLLLKYFPNIKIEIIGAGPDEEYFKNRIQKSKLNIRFHGLVEEKVFNKILSNCTIGIAPYVPDSSNASFYGDPGKVKRYISFGMPVIITNVFEFSLELKKAKAGVIINYYKPIDFLNGIKMILKNYQKYSQGSIELSRKYYFKKIYPAMFKFY